LDDRTTFDRCGDQTPDNTNERIALGFCAENIANLTVCSSQNCTEDGHRCITADDLTNQESCILAGTELTSINDTLPNGQTAASIYNITCGGGTRAACGNGNERNRAAWALEAAAGFTQCSISSNCQLAGDNDPSCNTANDINRFFDCMDNLQTINDELYSDNTVLPVSQPENCTGGTLLPSPGTACNGVPEFGSSRMDNTLSVLLNVLDSDNSLDDTSSLTCNDASGMWSNTTNEVISCKDFLETPFRNVSDYIYDGGTITPFPSTDDEAINLPSTPSTSIREQLTDADADNFNINFLPMYYSGEDNGDACDPNGENTVIDDQSAYGMASGGFQGGDAESINRVWDFYRQEKASGGTPLALILGFDDASNPTAGDNSFNVKNDAILAFSNDMPDDPALDCRAEFVIVITDGDDSCSGDCSNDSSSCSGSAAASSNANRRSSINAVSKLRTHFSRNPVTSNVTGIGTVKKEVITFVVGLGIDDPNAVRALNAMALAGGTHTTGIIKHSDPATGEVFGTIEIDATAPDSILPGSDNDEFQIYRDIAKAEGIDSATPADALIGGCDNPDVNGTCTFGSDNVFNNQYLDSGLHTDGVTPVDLNGFAFLANTPEELAAAIDSILIKIQEFTTSGVAPTAPQSSINVSARDRMFLSILTPIESERLWQGRLALYGFVSSQITDNPGARTIIRKPNVGSLDSAATVASLSIFDSNGNLNDNAKAFYWEAAKNLTEKNLSGVLTPGTRRNLYTTDSLTTSTQNSNVITSDLKEFCCDNCLNPCPGSVVQITPEELGIEDEDVYAETIFPPEACNDDTDDLVNCTDDCIDVTSAAIDITDNDAEDCRECIKGCFRDEVINFMSGDTGIQPLSDPMGQPTTSAVSSESFGFNCLNEEETVGSFDTCTLRLGDVFHSTPVLVASPSPLFFDTGFQLFARGFLKRSAALYAGANDGFLHAFHAGEFVDASEASPAQNPFTLENETVPFFNEGTGIEVFGFAPPTYLFDTLSNNSADQPFGFDPDFRLGDFKSFVLENNAQRSFFDGSPTISDIWVDAYQNGLDDDTNICPQGDGVTIGTPDGNFDLCGREWHTVLASGMRNGGGAITALNVTNFKCDAGLGDTECGNATSNFKFEGSGRSFPEHLWTTYDEDFGNTWSQPFIGRVQLEVDEGGGSSSIIDRYVYFVGGGLDPTDTMPRDGVNKGNGFYVIDAPTGNILFKFHPDNPTDNSLENITEMQCDMAANVLGVDINIDGFTDVVYAGDTCGRMWRFDVSMPLETSGSLATTGKNGTAVLESPDWTGSVAFCTGTCLDGDDNVVIPPDTEDLQSVYFAPTVAFDRIGRRHVIFVTGNRRNPSKIADFDETTGDPITGTNEFGRLFNFIDNYIPAFLAGGTAIPAPIRTETEFATNSQFINLNLSSSTSATGNELFEIQAGAGFDDGLGEFMVEFPDNVSTRNGEKGFGRPLVLGRVLVFTTFAPDSLNTNPCTASFGAGRLFALDYLTGASALSRIPGAQQSILDGVSNADHIAGATVAEGLPTTANLAFGTQGSAVLTVAFSGSPGSGGAQFLIWETPQKPAVTQTVFWEEII